MQHLREGSVRPADDHDSLEETSRPRADTAGPAQLRAAAWTRRVRLGPRLAVMTVVPVAALLMVIVLQGRIIVDRYNAASTFGDHAETLRRGGEILSSLQRTRATALAVHLNAAYAGAGETESEDRDTLALDRFFARTNQSPTTLRRLVERADAARGAPGTTRPDAGYTRAIDHLLSSLQELAGTAPTAALDGEFNALLALTLAAELLRRQDIEVRVGYDTASPVRDAIQGLAVEERSAMKRFRHYASEALVSSYNAALRAPAWGAVTRARNDLIEPWRPRRVDRAVWAGVVEARLSSLESLRRQQSAALETAVTTEQHRASGLLWLIVLTTLLATALVVVAGWLVRRSVVDPLLELQQAAHALTAGRLVPLRLSGNDEMTDVSHAFNDVGAAVADLIDQVDGIASDLRAGELPPAVDTRELTGVWATLGGAINDGLDAAREGRAREHAAKRSVHHAKHHDPDTGLPNRRGLKALTAKRFGTALPLGTTTAVVQVTNIAQLRGAHGEHTARRALTAVGQRVREAMSAQAVVGRLSPTEFVVIDHLDGEVLCHRLRHVFAHPVEVSGTELLFPAAIGYCASEPGLAADEHLSRAVIAAEQARILRRQAPLSYATEMKDAAVRREMVRDWLSKSIATRTLRPAFQPIVDFSTGKIAGYEVLARGVLDGHAVLPAEFVPAAEESGQIGQLGSIVRQHGLAAYSRLPGEAPYLAVNFAVAQLRDKSLAARLESELTLARVPVDRFVVEITESAVVADREVIRTLASLRELGVSIAIDDFGTGYSSLAYLARLPLQIIKLDRGLISPIVTNSAARKVVARTLELAHDLGLRVVAEGIENRQQAQILRDFACGLGQGYYFAPPTSVDELQSLDNLRWLA